MRVQFLEDDVALLVVRPEGTMQAAEGADLAAAVEGRVQPATETVAIDLAELDFVSLGGIRALLRLARSLKGDGRDLEFHHGGAVVRHALEQAGMAEFFPFTPALHSNRGHHHESP